MIACDIIIKIFQKLEYQTTEEVDSTYIVSTFFVVLDKAILLRFDRVLFYPLSYIDVLFYKENLPKI